VIGLEELFERNRAWAAATTAEDQDFFTGRAERQAPAYLWIGCSDSRVPANQTIGLLPGDLRQKINQVRIRTAAPGADTAGI
jgi:carbonic anhydrase